MEHMYPRHVEGCLRRVPNGFPLEDTAAHKYYGLVCPCGEEQFDLLQSNLDSVVAVCSSCKTRIILYDWALYHAAVKLKGDEEFFRMPTQRERPSRVFVGYEYGPTEADEEFNSNDISWCQVFASTSNGEIIEVFNDETA